MIIEEIMTKRIVTVELDDSLKTVKEIFDNVQFHHLLAIESDALFGVISDRDLFRAISPNIGSMFETEKDLATLNKKVHQIVTRKPVTIAPTENVSEAIGIFNRNNISCIPVIDKNNIPIGIVSWRDILKTI